MEYSRDQIKRMVRYLTRTVIDHACGCAFCFGGEDLCSAQQQMIDLRERWIDTLERVEGRRGI